MRFTIDEDICEKNDCSLPELLVILLLKLDTDIPAVIQSLLNSQKIVKEDLFDKLYITQHWSEVADTILLDSDNSKVAEERIESLALQLMELFPKGKKEGTCHYFRGNKKDTILRLKKFFKLYGNKYTDDQIITATKKYVDSFNGDYSYMRILKYFIWKDLKRVGEDGLNYIEETSDLASYIDNDDVDEINRNWTDRLV